MMGKSSKTETKTPAVPKDENTVRILSPRREHTAALFWDVYRNTTPSDDE